MVVHGGCRQCGATNDRTDRIAKIERDLHGRACNQLATALTGLHHEQLLWRRVEEQCETNHERQHRSRNEIAGNEKHQQQTNRGDGLRKTGSGTRLPQISQTAASNTAKHHAETSKHH